MKTIRRIYFYLVTFISVIALVWGITNLLRSITSQQFIGDQSSDLSTGLAQILVSIPIFLLHWLIVQRDAQKSEEEKNSLVRGIYLYSILLSSLIPVVQNLIALLNRLLLQAAQLNPQRAIFGGYQTLTDNLIAIVVNLILAVYFYRVLQSDWVSSTDTNCLVDLRRLYRYAWMLYSLGLTIIGVQKLVVYILAVQPILFFFNGQEQFSNALTLLLIGTPLWSYWWHLIQSMMSVEEERNSTIRTLILYILTLTGALTFSINTGEILYQLLRTILEEFASIQNLLAEISTPVSLALTFGVLWAYYSRILKINISLENDTIKQGAMHRIYRHILAGLGLAGTIIGVASIMGWLIDLVLENQWIWQIYSLSLAQYLAVLCVGMALWLVYWPKVNREAVQTGEVGDHARRSLSRKIYLYLVIFACVIGVMASAGFLIYSILQSLFGTDNSSLLNDILQYFRLILLFAAFLAYHLNWLRRDNRTLTTSLQNLQTAFPVVALLDPESTRGKGIQKTFQRFAGTIPLKLIPPHQMEADSLVDAAVVVLETSLLEEQAIKFTGLVKDYLGKIIVLPASHSRYIWLNSHLKEADILKGCALAARSLAEGQEVQPITTNSPWMIFAYIIAGLVGLQILASVLIMAFSG